MSGDLVLNVVLFHLEFRGYGPEKVKSHFNVLGSSSEERTRTYRLPDPLPSHLNAPWQRLYGYEVRNNFFYHWHTLERFEIANLAQFGAVLVNPHEGPPTSSVRSGLTTSPRIPSEPQALERLDSLLICNLLRKRSKQVRSLVD